MNQSKFNPRILRSFTGEDRTQGFLNTKPKDDQELLEFYRNFHKNQRYKKLQTYPKNQ